MESLAEMVATGESLERQHYIAIWDTIQRSDERTLTQAAQDIATLQVYSAVKYAFSPIFSARAISRFPPHIRR